jgi:hypothetical protein
VLLTEGTVPIVSFQRLADIDAELIKYSSILGIKHSIATEVGQRGALPYSCPIPVRQTD